MRWRMLQAILRLVAPSSKRDEIIQVFRSLIGPTEVSIGCLACRTFLDVDDDLTITYLVEWENRAQLDAHFQTTRFRQLLPYIELSQEPPQVEVRSLDRIGGIEVMVAAIGAGPSNSSQSTEPI